MLSLAKKQESENCTCVDRLFGLFEAVFSAHIKTKTTDSLFHEKSEEFYSVLFDAFHQISEKRQDLSEDSPIDCEEASAIAIDSLNEAKDIIEKMIKEKNTVGMDNILRGLADRIESSIGNATPFVKNS